MNYAREKIKQKDESHNEEIKQKDEAMKHLREENTTLKTTLASAEAKLKSIQDKKDDMENSSLNDTINVKVKQEANVKQETDIDTDDDERASTLSSNDTGNVKVKQEANVKQEADIDTDDDEMGSPEKKKQKTEKA